MSAWKGKPCANPDCPNEGRKGPKQRNQKFCWTCAREKNKAQNKAQHDTYLQKTYGITEEDYDALFEFQGGKCALCRWATGRSRRLSVDHDHKCSAGHDPKLGCPDCVRGLLCRPCNNLMGHARDLIAFFERCIAYLRKTPWQRMKDGEDWPY